jgi:hypothetical protein
MRTVGEQVSRKDHNQRWQTFFVTSPLVDGWSEACGSKNFMMTASLKSIWFVPVFPKIYYSECPNYHAGFVFTTGTALLVVDKIGFLSTESRYGTNYSLLTMYLAERSSR